MSNIAAIPITPNVQITNPDGTLTITGFRYFLAMWSRTGSGQGTDTNVVRTTALAAQATATTAQATAVAASAAAGTAQTTANSATSAVALETTNRIAAVSGEATTRAAADALLAPQANPTFSGVITFPLLTNAINDAAAATAGVAVLALYRNGSIVMQRVV